MAVPDFPGLEGMAVASNFNSIVIRGGVDQLDFWNDIAAPEIAKGINPPFSFLPFGCAVNVGPFQLHSATNPFCVT